MRIIVTGATGNVGTALLRRLLPDPSIESITALARRTPSPQACLAEGIDGSRITWVGADLSRDDLASHFHGIDAVVHLAWLFQPSHRPDVTWRNNVLGTRRLLDAVSASGVRALVAASSIAAYDPAPPGAAREVDESWPTNGASSASYAREKAYVERILDAFELQQPDCRVARMRPAFIFQQSSAMQQRRLFGGPLAPMGLVGRRRVPILPMPRDLRLQVLHAADAAQAYQLALAASARGAFNLASEPVLSAQRLAELFDARLVPVPARLVRGALALGWTSHLVPAEPALWDALVGLPQLDTRRARSELGWLPEYDSAVAIEELLAGLRSARGGATPPLDPRSSGTARSREFASGVGSRP